MTAVLQSLTASWRKIRASRFTKWVHLNSESVSISVKLPCLHQSTRWVILWLMLWILWLFTIVLNVSLSPTGNVPRTETSHPELRLKVIRSFRNKTQISYLITDPRIKKFLSSFNSFPQRVAFILSSEKSRQGADGLFSLECVLKRQTHSSGAPL